MLTFTLIVLHTPLWVWPLLLVLLLLGLRQTRTQRMGWARITLLPAALLGLSVYGTLAVAGTHTLALLLWALVALAAATWVLRRPLPAGTRYELAHRRFTVPGSAVPLALMLGIFCTKYAVGATQAMAPALLQADSVVYPLVALSGLCSGILLGRSLRLCKLAVDTEAQWHHSATTARFTV